MNFLKILLRFVKLRMAFTKKKVDERERDQKKEMTGKQ